MEASTGTATVRRALGWSLLSTSLSRVWSFAVGIVIARILEPEHYAVFAVGFLALTILQSMNELGVSVAVVRWPTDPRELLPTATTLAIGFSGLIFTLTFFLAPVISNAMRVPDATGVVRLLAVGAIIDGLGSIPGALLTRSLQQGRRVIADLGGMVTSTVVSLWLAITGAGAWSLAWGALAGNLVTTAAVLYLAPNRPRPGFAPPAARSLLRTGLPLAGASLLVLAMLNVDYMVVGRTLGKESLAFYVFAFNLSSWMPAIISAAVRRVAVVGFARAQSEPDQLAALFGRALSLLGCVALPAGLTLSILADPLLRTVYGTNWDASAPPLRFLAVLSIARVLVDLCYDALVATGHARRILVLQGVWLAILVPALTIGARVDGIRGVAVAHAVVAVAVVIPLFTVALHKAGLAVTGLPSAAARPMLCGAVAALVAFAARSTSGQAWLQLLLGGFAAIAAVAAVVLRGGWLRTQVVSARS